MTTVNEIFSIAMDLIDEREDSGNLNESQTIGYRVKTPGIVNLLQSELIKQGDLFATYEISNRPITNELGFISNFDIREFIGEELTFEANRPAQAYYFEVDRVGTVYVEDFNGSWNTLATITAVNNPSGFTAYKGIVTPSAGATRSRLRFGGSFYYRTVNRALFNVPFASSGDIPNYKPWTPYDMPMDFKSVNEIVEETPDRQYHNTSNYKWEGRNKLFVNYYFTGKIRIVYRPIPTLITAMDDVLQLDDVTCRTVVPYGLASHLMLEENPLTASYFNGRYIELKEEAGKMPPSASEMINNVYGTFG
jgi:hypothetical protein